MANPTTNYSFVLPTSSDLVTDLPADFDVALQGVDTRLKALQPGTTAGDLAYSSATANTNVRLGIGTSGQVLAVVSGVPAWTTTADVTPLTTKGDLFTFSTVDARLPVGTNGQVLTADSTQSTGLKYATPAAGGKVLQVVSATHSTQASSSSTTFADTGLTATITPTLNTSKVLVIVSQAGVTKHPGDNSNGVAIKLLRGSTSILTMDFRAGFTFSPTFNFIGSVSGNLLDAPATTSATTYKTQFANFVAAGNIFVQQDNCTSTITLLEIGA